MLLTMLVLYKTYEERKKEETNLCGFAMSSLENKII